MSNAALEAQLHPESDFVAAREFTSRSPALAANDRRILFPALAIQKSHLHV